MSSEGTWSQDLLAELIHFSVSCALSRHSDLLLTLPGVHPITHHYTRHSVSMRLHVEFLSALLLCVLPRCHLYNDQSYSPFVLSRRGVDN